MKRKTSADALLTLAPNHCFSWEQNGCIGHQMQELGLPEATPEICRYDYGITKLMNTDFSREQNLAGGGTVCDYHYRKRV